MIKDLVIANFGAPRNLNEIDLFLKEILIDKNIVNSKLPQFLHNLFFIRIAKKRSVIVKKKYEIIGGKSPLFEETENIAKKLNATAFHRYLPQTHETFMKKIKNKEEIIVFPMFPQYSSTTSGGIFKWLNKNLNKKTKIHFIKSYATNPIFIELYKSHIHNFLMKHNLRENDVFFIFSAHSIPLKLAKNKDQIYVNECEASYKLISKEFPKAKSILAYQSHFGKNRGLQPQTIDIVKNATSLVSNRSMIIVPLSFTIDNLETLYEIDYQYIPIIKQQEINAFRLPAFNSNKEWIDAIPQIINQHFSTP